MKDFINQKVKELFIVAACLMIGLFALWASVTIGHQLGDSAIVGGMVFITIISLAIKIKEDFTDQVIRKSNPPQ